MAVPINGSMLKSVRGQRSLSQQKLAEKSLVSIVTIKRIETSKKIYNANIITAKKLARALEIEVEDLGEESFEHIIGLGEELGLCLERYTDPDAFMEFSKNIARLMKVRNRLLGKGPSS